MSDTKAILKIEDLTVSIQEKKILDKLNIQVLPGQVHAIMGKNGSGKVFLRAAPAGTGIIAGGPMRAVFETLGVQDVVAKSVGTSNPHNMIKATFQAFSFMNSPRSIASKRGKKVSDIFGTKDNNK